MNKLKTGFIIPSDKENFDPFRNQPLNALYLVTILNKKYEKETDNQIIDLRGISEKSRIYHIPEKDIYFYSVASVNSGEISEIVKDIRKVYPKSKHIAGGIHINIFPNESKQIFDTIALKEGEQIIGNIVEDFLNGNLKKIYEQSSPIDINDYPYSNREYLPKSSISLKGLLKQDPELTGTAVIFSRDCPFNCHFCANLKPSKIRYRSPKLIEEEINYLKKNYGIEALAVKDDQSISLNKKTAEQTLEAIARTDVKWRGQCRVFNIDYDTIKLAKESGCVEVAVGIESVSQKVLDIINKKIDIKKAGKFLDQFKENGIDTRLHFIMGLPGEHRGIGKETIRFIQEFEPSSVLITLLTPTPGSEIYNNPKRFGIKPYEASFDKLFSLAGRLDKKEIPQLTFEYEKNTPFGESLSNDEIIKNHREVLNFLWEHNLNF